MVRRFKQNKRESPIKRFFRYEGKILLISLIGIVLAGCATWRTFFRTPQESEIRRDFLVKEIADDLGMKPVRLAKFNGEELEIIERLNLNGMIALDRYPEATVRLYREMKSFELFYQIIDEFGPQHIIPVLDYFYTEGNAALAAEQQLNQLIDKVFGKSPKADSLSDRQKRLLSILNEIQYQKHNFLARFIFTESGAKRNYVATTTSTIVNFFTGGLSNFNAAVATRGLSHVTGKELLDAGIDVVVLIPVISWFARSAKSGAAALRGGTITERTIVRQGSRAVVESGKMSKIAKASGTVWRTLPLRTLLKFKYVKWYALALVVVKPSLLNHAAALVAKGFSLPPILVKTGFWFLILFPLLNLLVPISILLWKVIKKWILQRSVYELDKFA
ncbi:hypothetical protein B6D60_11845 [candidate division KSB1 bacterium 4484_87]|nr:MAG: hypothetical protein B6D60_11845 [candidate division KSB1 bacterium 4484_87]